MKPEDLPERDLIFNIAIEATELAWTCMEMVRVLDGNSRTPEAEARDRLLKGMADVMLSIKVKTTPKEDNEIHARIIPMYQTWRDMINGK